MKKIFVILQSALFLISAMYIQAQEKVPVYLVLELTDNSIQEFRLATKPEIEFTGDMLKVTSGELEKEYPQTDVAQFYFTETSAGIKAPVSGNDIAIRYTDNETVTITGASVSYASLYDTEGKFLSRTNASDGVTTNC